jgi:hypothetical protein
MQESGYELAIRIAIEQCELGEYPEQLGWPDWCDEISYAPSRDEEQEAATLFADDDLETEFQVFLENLPDRTFAEVKRALDVIREAIRDFNADRMFGMMDMPSLLGFIDID